MWVSACNVLERARPIAMGLEALLHHFASKLAFSDTVQTWRICYNLVCV